MPSAYKRGTGNRYDSRPCARCGKTIQRPERFRYCIVCDEERGELEAAAEFARLTEEWARATVEREQRTKRQRVQP